MASPDLFRLVFRYVNRGPASVSGRVSVRDQGKFATCANCECRGLPPGPRPTHASPQPAPPRPRTWVGGPALPAGPGGGAAWVAMLRPGGLPSLPPGTEQSQPVAFPPSTEPAFVTVPQRGFGEPFVLNPGAWALLVEAEGVLLVRRG